MLKRRRRFDRELKIQAIKQVINGERTMGQTANDFGVLPSVVSRWKSEYSENPASPFPGGGNAKIDPEAYFRLVKQLREITNERDILRKAIALLYKREGLTGDV